jgi:uncharacterized membrane protein
MNINDLKILGFNASTMAISFTNAERALKILLLCVSIIYTVLKIIEMKSKKDEADKVILVNRSLIAKMVQKCLMTFWKMLKSCS